MARDVRGGGLFRHGFGHGRLGRCTGLSADGAASGRLDRRRGRWMSNRFHDLETYAGFSWHAPDSAFRAAARLALAEVRGKGGKTAITWNDEAQRETDDGGYLVWKAPATFNAAHAWF